MDVESLLKRISLIYKKELSDKKNGATFAVEESNQKSLSFPNSQLCLDLYSSIEKDEALRKNAESAFVMKKDSKLLPLQFWTLCALGKQDLAVQAILKYSGSEILEVEGTIFDLFDLIIEFDLVNLSTDEIYDIHKYLENIGTQYSRPQSDLKSRILDEILEKGIDGIKSELKSSNVEINKDKEEVRRIIKYLDFDDKYNELLTEIDNFLNTESKVVSAGLIGNLREFLSQLITDISKRIAAVVGEEIPLYTNEQDSSKVLTPIACARKYIKIKLELSDKDNKFIDAFIDILHEEGGHAFTSNKEYFRLSRNIAVEISLLLLSKLTKFVEKK